MVGLAGTSYVGKQYQLCFKSSKGYLPDGSSEETAQSRILAHNHLTQQKEDLTT